MILQLNETQINIPLSADDLTAEQGFYISALERKYKQEYPEPDIADYAAHISEVLSYLQIDVSQIPFGDVLKIFHNDAPVPILQTLENGDDITACTLYSNVLFARQTGTSTPFFLPYEFEGEKWTIANVEGVLRQDVASLTLQEVVEVLSLKDMLSKFLNAPESELMEAGQIAATELHLTALEVAMLLRRVGEKPPATKKEMHEFSTNRVAQIKRMPLSVINEVTFFLQNILKVFFAMRIVERLEAQHNTPPFG